MTNKSELKKAVKIISCSSYEEIEKDFKKQFKKYPEFKEVLEKMKRKQCK